MEDVMKKAYHVQALRRASHVLWLWMQWHWRSTGVHPVTLVTTVLNVYVCDIIICDGHGHTLALA